MIAFKDLCCTPEVLKKFDAIKHASSLRLELGRVVSVDRGFPLINTQTKQVRAELATTIMKSDDSIVAIGDWVALQQPQGHEKAIVRAMLERTNEIARIKRVGREGQTQRHVLAANVDTVLICQALSGAGLDVRLAARQITAVCGSDARACFVLTKCDMVSSKKARRAQKKLKSVFPDVDVMCVGAQFVDENGDAQDLEGVQELLHICISNTTTLLLGESGVGKSTLVNSLLGTKHMQTAQVRKRDDKGRHTTVARHIIAVPKGGLLIDAPGIRTLQIMNLPEALKKTFPDVYNAALQCKFSNCTHTHEPGCAVQYQIDKARLAAFIRLSKYTSSN